MYSHTRLDMNDYGEYGTASNLQVAKTSCLKCQNRTKALHVDADASLFIIISKLVLYCQMKILLDSQVKSNIIMYFDCFHIF